MIQAIYHVSTRDMIRVIHDDDTHDTQWYNQDIWWYIMISCIENSLFLYWKFPQSRVKRRSPTVQVLFFLSFLNLNFNLNFAHRTLRHSYHRCGCTSALLWRWEGGVMFCCFHGALTRHELFEGQTETRRNLRRNNAKHGHWSYGIDTEWYLVLKSINRSFLLHVLTRVYWKTASCNTCITAKHISKIDSKSQVKKSLNINNRQPYEAYRLYFWGKQWWKGWPEMTVGFTVLPLDVCLKSSQVYT